MAVRPRGYGLTAELNAKKEKKFDINLTQDAFLWIEELINEPVEIPETLSDVQEILKDGVILCKLANAIEPGAVKQINTKAMAFKMMENIGNFLCFCESYGLRKTDLFQTVDLYEKQNIPQVISALHALGRKVNVKRPELPPLGPKESEKVPREFSIDQLKATDAIIGLQMGSNRGANQSGINFGLHRQII